MTEQEQKIALLEERYATLRVEVRDKYENCQYLKQNIADSMYRIDVLKSAMQNVWFFKRFKMQKEINELCKSVELDQLALDIIESELKPISEEMEEIELQIQPRLELLYGKDQGWWIRK